MAEKEEKMPLEVGMKHTVTITVTDAMCADHLDSQLPQLDLPHVFSTPSMINLMEITSGDLMNRYAPEGKCSVGMSVEIKHIAATAAGETVTCETEVAESDGRKVLFRVNAYDKNGKIGFGTHKRAYIDK